MALRRDTDYALQLLTLYARSETENGCFIGRREVLRKTSLTAESQARLCHLLREHGYLEMGRNPKQKEIGYRLALPPEQITVKQVIELTENSTELLAVFDKRAAIYGNIVWERLQLRLDQELASITVADLLKAEGSESEKPERGK